MFRVEEVSAGVYTVTGRDTSGRSVELTGTDPDALVHQVKDFARQALNDHSDE